MKNKSNDVVISNIITHFYNFKLWRQLYDVKYGDRAILIKMATFERVIQSAVSPAGYF